MEPFFIFSRYNGTIEREKAQKGKIPPGKSEKEKERDKMTSRERVMAAVNHKEPDYLPLDLGSNVSTGISGQAYANLKEYLGIKEGHTRIYDVVQQVAQPEECVLNLIGADALDVARVYNEKDSDW